MSGIVHKIIDPSVIPSLRDEERSALASEIRALIIENVSQNGGHLASNLGVVELSIALLSCFTPPVDQIVFDVGHQCYAYKILTGRSSQFCTLRQKDGLSGFPLRSESQYDCFGTGHSSTSISAALGLLRAKKLSRMSGRVIAVIGDGALSGGMAYEALNDAGQYKENLIVILNDNQMSIDRNVGAISRHLDSLRSSAAYLRVKNRTEHMLSRIPLLGKPISRFLLSIKDLFRMLVHRKNPVIFESLGFRYYGPFDGHDIPTLIKKINAVRNMNQPVLIHVCTCKGKGYDKAEEMPSHYHGVAPFDIEIGFCNGDSQSFTSAFSESMIKISEKRDEVVAVSAGMMSSSGLQLFRDRFPNRFFDVGIAEEHAVTFSAGLAANGAIPVIALYSTFLQRSYDQILHDICLQNLHVVFAIDRSGIVGADGPTHQGLYDISMLYPMPNIEIYAPRDYEDLHTMLEYAINQAQCPVAIRYPRSSQTKIPSVSNPNDVESQILLTGSDAVLFSVGAMTPHAYQAALVLKEKGISCSVVDLRRIKPISKRTILDAIKGKKLLICCEEGVASGGVSSHLGMMLLQNKIQIAYLPINVCAQGILIATRDENLALQKMNALSIANRIEGEWERLKR